MKVYGHPLSSCTRKIMITLAEKGEKADFVLVDLFAGEHKSDAHLARHPFGVIPVLEDDGFVLYESRAILRYLNRRFPAPPLVPESAREAARMDQWLSVDQSYVAPHTRSLAIERVVKAREGKAPDAAAERAAEAALRLALAAIDRGLGERPYLAGDGFTLADVSLMPYVASLKMLRAEDLLGGLANLGAWWARVSARESWKAADARAE
jgi:glutathione S-transferase